MPKQEVQWTQENLIPLLRRIGFRRVAFTHGVMEAGRDVVFADYDRFGLQRYYAAQVKDGNLRARSETREIGAIIEQANNAYSTPYRDMATGTEHQIAGVYLIVNGNVSDSAKQILFPKTGNWFSIIDRDQLGVADMIAPRIGDRMRKEQFVFLKQEVRKNTEYCQNALDPDNGILGEVKGEDITTRLPEGQFGVRWLERIIETSANEFDVDDFALLYMYLTDCEKVNYVNFKIPLGVCDEYVARSVEALRGHLQIALKAGPYVIAFCDYVLESERPEPGKKLSKSPKTQEFFGG